MAIKSGRGAWVHENFPRNGTSPEHWLIGVVADRHQSGSYGRIPLELLVSPHRRATAPDSCVS